jgi:hypothetical protein
MSIEKMLVLSTGHLTEKTANALDHFAFVKRPGRPTLMPGWLVRPIVYPHGEYGWLIPVVGDISDDHTIRAHLPAELLDCIIKAEDAECSWLLFDRDADRIDGLHFFEW